ncbi:hypothetical protein GN958_ATG08592 [Phytophthora infestans]|uniref:Uncharacterized protein n=1 Tax=Phytophthora infestans TaxID=4787 RepID=A0A8S9UNM8_PHYIN|nr:hypothetical protein GN958_ATG08592 [Phytophthora infestans]
MLFGGRCVSRGMNRAELLAAELLAAERAVCRLSGELLQTGTVTGLREMFGSSPFYSGIPGGIFMRSGRCVALPTLQ